MHLCAHFRRFRAHRKLRLFNGLARKYGPSAAHPFMFHYRAMPPIPVARVETSWEDSETAPRLRRRLKQPGNIPAKN